MCAGGGMWGGLLLEKSHPVNGPLPYDNGPLTDDNGQITDDNGFRYRHLYKKNGQITDDNGR